MKKLSSILSVLFTFLLLSQTAFAATFSDVPESHQFYVPIESLKNLEIINGYPDGTFKPEREINRVEALKIILNSAGIESPETTEDTGFFDTSSTDWYARYIIKAKSLGIVKGNPDGSFAPTRVVNKAEFVKMLLESFEVDLSKHQTIESPLANDTDIDSWYNPYFSYAKTVGIITPTLDNKLEPGKNLTRGESSEIIYKLLVIERGGDAQKMLNITEAKLVDVLVQINNNNIQTAINSANDAVFYSEKAIQAAPEIGLPKAANQIALGFRELCLGYQAGLDKNNEALLAHATKAEEYAGAAYGFDQSTQELGKKIKEHATILKGQVQ